MNTYFVTFGRGHSHAIHGAILNCSTIAEFTAENDEASEVKANNFFGNDYATVEPANEFCDGMFAHITGGIVRVDY